MYNVKRNRGGDWTATRLPSYQVSTKHAAVNGQSNILDKAKTLMAHHVSYAFDQSLKEYTLFHNPSDGGKWDTYESSLDKRGQTTGVTKEFSKVLNNVQTGQHNVEWIAHSQGGVIFTEAVRFHIENGGETLGKNSVVFHAGANNIKKTENNLSMAGITILGYNDHPYDIVPQLFGGHATSVSNVVGSVLHSLYVFNGSSERSPHTLPFQGMDNYVNQMPGWYQKSYNGAQKVENEMNNAAQWAKEKANVAYDYVESLPSRIKAQYKIFRK